MIQPYAGHMRQPNRMEAGVDGRKSIATSRSIAALRALAGWNQTEAAQQMGISTPTLGAIEQNQRTITVPAASKLAAKFGITIDDVVFGTWAHVAIQTDDADASAGKSHATTD